MFQVPPDIMINPVEASFNQVSFDKAMHAGNGRVPFYRGELFLSSSELEKLNEYLQSVECPFGKPRFVEVREPPLIPSFVSPVPSTVTFSPLPARSTRASFPNYGTSAKTVVTGGKSGSGKSVRSSTASSKPEPVKERTSSNTAPVEEPVITPRVETSEEATPMIPMNREKIRNFILTAYTELSNDPDYACLYEEYIPQGMTPPLSLSTVQDRVDKEMYLDHFQLQDDVIALVSYWLNGPPMPNPMLPQYMASLKLLRKSTEWMINNSGSVDNEDYYTGPDVEAAIKAEARREQLAPRPSQTTTSPSFARKVRKTQSVGSASGGGDLKDIEAQVALLTQQVMGLHKTKTSSAPGQPRTSTSAPMRQDSMSPEEIRKLETDLMRLSPDDIDYIIGTLLKDEPSVKVDDESYELDVGALPTARQRALRRFVTRRLNIADPNHEVQKLKQILKHDELARASEEMAERLLAASSTMTTAAIAPISAPVHPTISPEEEQRQRQREEEARRLWRIAHGEEDDDMDVDQ